MNNIDTQVSRFIARLWATYEAYEEAGHARASLDRLDDFLSDMIETLESEYEGGRLEESAFVRLVRRVENAGCDIVEMYGH